MGLLRARLAEIMDHFHWTPEQIAQLTVAQIENLCFHARDEKTKEITRPKPRVPLPVLTEEEHVARVRGMFRGSRKVDREKLEAKIAEIRAYYAKKRGE